MNNCPLCGKPLKYIKNGNLDFIYKNKNYILKNMSYSECKYCDEQFFDAKQAHEFSEKRNKLLEEQKALNENKGDKQMKIKNESWNNVYEYLSKAFNKLVKGYKNPENVPECLQTREILEKLTRLEMQKMNQEFFEEDLQEGLNRWFKDDEDYKSYLNDIFEKVADDLFNSEQFESVSLSPDFTIALEIKNEKEPILIKLNDLKELPYFNKEGEFIYRSEDIEDDIINDIIKKIFKIIDDRILNKTESYKREMKTNDIYFITDGIVYYFGKPEFFEEIAKEEGWNKETFDKTAKEFLEKHYTIIKLDNKELENDFIKYE